MKSETAEPKSIISSGSVEPSRLDGATNLGGRYMTSNPHLEALRGKHRELDKKVQQVEKHPGSSDAEIGQLKREKLHLKEQIAAYEAESA